MVDPKTMMTPTAARVRLTAALGPLAVILALSCGFAAHAKNWPEPQATAIPDAPGYVHVPGAAVPLDKSFVYKALFDAKTASAKPQDMLEVLKRVGLQLNGFALAGVPKENIHLAIIFHGTAVDGILNNDKYKEKFGIDNPNIKVVEELKQAGVRIYVCSQHMAKHDIPKQDILKEVEVGEAATMIMIRLSNQGYALIGE